jgi:soluble cytochrome b562
MFRLVCGFLLVLTPALLLGSCAKQAGVDQQADKNAGNAQDKAAATTPPYLQPTLRGDIERVSLAISMARDAVKLQKSQDAVALLRGAEKNVDEALNRKHRLRDEFVALKEALERAIAAIENRDKDADAKIEELQTRIGAIKVNASD